MKIGVRVKLDVTKIEKARLFKGQKGTYLDATVFIDLDQKDQYDNNGMVTQDISKEEKDAGGQGAILGNVQVFWSDGQQQGQQANRQQGQSNSQGFKNNGQNYGQQNNNNRARQQTNQAVQQNVNTNGSVDFDDDLAF
tara:strand:+ start:6083 stop:6496 length:414 start_codon:yes stop_codon:yes gene_type:complete